MGILLSSLLDGVPGSLILGLSLVQAPQVSLAFVFAMAISNIPEGLGGTHGMLRAGWSRRQVANLWLAVCGMSVLAAMVGYDLGSQFPGLTGAIIATFTAGSLLVMLSDSMIPEAFEHGGHETGLFLVLGFGVALMLLLVEVA